jgi:hypothetical protein
MQITKVGSEANKLGSLVARKNSLLREEFRSIAGGVSSAGDFAVDQRATE